MSKGKKTILVVEGDFYQHLAKELREGALAILKEAGYDAKVITVPGALEIAPAIAMGVKTEKFAGFVALGTVIRGETTHYDYVAGESIRALQDLAVKKRAAIGTGILTVENGDQAWARAARDKGNKGGKAAEACLALVQAKTDLLG